MTITEARDFVHTEIAKLERVNQDKELRPWFRDACPAASEYWCRIQQRIALSKSRPDKSACCVSLDLQIERTEAQQAAAEASRARLAVARRSKSFQGSVFPNEPATDSVLDGLGVMETVSA